MAPTRLLAIVVLSSALASIAAAEDVLDKSARANAPVADEIEVVKNLVFSSQRAGFERHDVKAYMAPLSKDIQIITGRSAKPDRYDLILDRKHIEACARMNYLEKPTHNATQSYKVVRAELTGDGALLEVVTSRTTPTNVSRTGEIFRLRKTPAGWQIFLNRCWMIDYKSKDQTFVFDADYWAEADRRVEQARNTGDPQQVVDSLALASRYQEAHKEARELTQGANVPLDAWIARGYLAVRIGDEEDARQSFARALSLDKDAPVPPYFRRESEE